MTAPTVKDRGVPDAQSEMYRASGSTATNTRFSGDGFIVRVATGAAIGVFGALAIEVLGIADIFGSSGHDLIVPLAVAGAILGATRLRSVLLGLAFAATLLILWIASTNVIVKPAQSLIRRDTLPSHADAIVVLSAGITSDGTLHPQASDRLIKGLELYARGLAPTLVLTREKRRIQGAEVTSQADQERMASLVGPSAARIVYAGATHSTRDEAVRVRQLSAGTAWKHIILVTSPLHSRRACRVFEKVGFTVSCIPADSRDLAVDRLINPGDKLRAFQLWLYETAGNLRYRQRGWL